MNIRSLLLGTLAAAGLASSGYAADLGVVTSLDVCDELGLSGLTISSDNNCLVITGYVGFEYDIGSYNFGASKATVASFNNAKSSSTTIVNDGVGDSTVDLDSWLKFVATSDTDFGPATATIQLVSATANGTSDWSVGVGEAWVGIGDTTVIMAGYKSSIFNKSDDTPLNYLGLFHSDNVDSSPALSSSTRGVGVAADFLGTDPTKTGGAVLQIVSQLGNGLTASAGIENLGTSPYGVFTGVGVLAYKGDDLTAHVSGAVNSQTGQWRTHAGFTGTWDPVSVVAAFAANSTGYWNGLASAAVTFDIFKLAASVEATHSAAGANPDELGAGASLTANVTDGVTLNLGGRYFTNNASRAYQAEAGVAAKAAEKITLTAAVGLRDTTYPSTLGLGNVYYGKVGAAWAPGGGFTASTTLEVTSRSAWQVVTKAAKTID